MQYDETSSLGGQSRASHSGGHPLKPRDANDIIREEGVDGLRRALDAAPRLATSAAPSHRNGNGASPSAADGASAGSDWPQLDGAAMHGLAGDIVRTIEPHSEADPVALLLQILVLAGNAIGANPYYAVEGDRHHANLFAVMVGSTSKARKGTGAGRIRSLIKLVDEAWNDARVKGGLSSGEGLINEVRDPVEKYDARNQAFEVVDPGISDKRLMVFEPEFAGALRVCERHGNTLSPLLRQAWDSHTLATMTRNNSLKASNPHISIVAHITADELRNCISRTDLANGLANRFLFAMVTRSKLLPFGGDLSDRDILEMADRLKPAIDSARSIGRVTMTAAAKKHWVAVYGPLSGDRDGLLGAVTARAEAQVVRLALVYALLDAEADINEHHLAAALAVWEYCETSAVHIFGELLGDPVADELLRALQQAGPEGMTRTAIRDLFGRHQSNDRITAALRLLATKGRARMTQDQTRGRPAETWFAVVR